MCQLKAILDLNEVCLCMDVFKKCKSSYFEMYFKCAD